jgi:hypothetical protein
MEKVVGLGFGKMDNSKEAAFSSGYKLSQKRFITILCGLFVFYLGMFLRYRPYDIDNPWFLSFSYNSYVEHICTDQFMNVRFPEGMDGTSLFGKLAAFVQFALLSQAGWQQWPAVVIASSFIVFSLATWWIKLRRLGYCDSFISAFLIIAGLSEPFLSAANKFRYEYFSFALLSSGLLLVAYRKPILGTFVAALAVEVQPAALVGIIPVIVLSCCMNKRTFGLFARLAVGLSLAAAAYFSLHPKVLHFEYSLRHSELSNNVWRGGFFGAFFFQRHRHLPELLIFLIAGIYYWRKRSEISSHYLGISAIAMSIFSLVMPHGNPSYMIFLYPFLTAMALSVVKVERQLKAITIFACAYALLQYAPLVYMNRNQGYRFQDINQVAGLIRDAEQQLAIRDEDLRIYGDYALWFAHPHFYRAAAQTTTSDAKDADLYLCFAHPLQGTLPISEGTFPCPDIKRLVPLRLLSTAMVRGSELYLYCKQRDVPK